MPLQKHLVYGPVRSQPLGRSLGLNILPAGVNVCTLDCAYCRHGWRRAAGRVPARMRPWPQPEQLSAALAARLRRAARDNEVLDRVTLAGHGESTLHPEFSEIVDRVVDVRDRFAPDLRLAVLSNSTTVAWPTVRRALARFDERYMKLDAGDAITYARINGLGTSLAAIVDALGGLPRVVVRAMFVTDGKGSVDNTTEGAIHAWVAAIAAIQPVGVQVYSADRQPRPQGLHTVPARRLREIAERVRTLDIPVDVFSSGWDTRRAMR